MAYPSVVLYHDLRSGLWDSITYGIVPPAVRRVLILCRLLLYWYTNSSPSIHDFRHIGILLYFLILIFFLYRRSYPSSTDFGSSTVRYVLSILVGVVIKRAGVASRVHPDEWRTTTMLLQMMSGGYTMSIGIHCELFQNEIRPIGCLLMELKSSTIL